MFKNAGIFQYNRPFNSFLNPCQKVVSREYFFKIIPMNITFTFSTFHSWKKTFFIFDANSFLLMFKNKKLYTGVWLVLNI